MVAAVVVAMLVASGCGSSDPVTSKSAPEILAAAQRAAKDASSVNITYDLRQGRLRSTLDAHVTAAKDGSTHLTLGPTTVELLRVGQSTYLKAGPYVYSQLGLKHVPANTWIELPAASTGGGLLSLTDQAKLTQLYLASNGQLTKGKTTTVDGRPAVELKETGRNLYTATIYIAATGTPYPLQITRQGRESGTITFDDWNQPVVLTTPANVFIAR